MNRKIKCLFFLILGILFAACQLEEDYLQNQDNNPNLGRYKMQYKKFDELILDTKMAPLIKNYPKKEEIISRKANRTIYA